MVFNLGRKTATYAASTRTEYDYDVMNRLSTVTVTEREGVDLTATNDEEVTIYHYDQLGRMDAQDQANGVTVDYVYDALNRVDVIYHFTGDDGDGMYESGGSETLVASFDYAYDAFGNRTQAIEWIDASGGGVSTTFDWTYDNLNRLIEEQLTSPTIVHYTTTYAFDLSSNRVAMTTDSADATQDATVTYTHDANDRLLTEVKDYADAGQTDTYTYCDSSVSDLNIAVLDGSMIALPRRLPHYRSRP